MISAGNAIDCTTLRQGHILTTECDQRYLVISQTCDVVLPQRPTITLAKVTQLQGNDLGHAKSRKTPRYVPVPELGDDFFGDLAWIESKLKTELVGYDSSPGIDFSDPIATRDLSLSLERWFGRFAFPDEIVPTLAPLAELVQKRYRKNSPLGELLRSILVEVRIQEDNQWIHAPYNLTVHTIVKAEALPTLDDDTSIDAQKTVPSVTDVAGKLLKPDELAKLYQTVDDNVSRQIVLSALAQSFMEACVVSDVVNSLNWSLAGDDEFSISQVRTSVPLDLEYLSNFSPR